MGSYETETICSDEGYFELELPAYAAGGPWEIILNDGEDEILIRDILFGDVFLLGGQSNMELPVERVMGRYGEEILKTSEDEIRMFEVPKEFIFGEKRKELEKGCWIKAKGEELQLFSAAGYFAAKEIHDREGIPVGLLQTAVGNPSNRKKGKTVQITFGPSGIALHTEKRTPDLKEIPGISQKQESNAPVRGFEAVYTDGKRMAAEGRMTGANSVEVTIPANAAGISYAWNDCPWEANLYSEEELPLVPFEVLFQEMQNRE